MPYHENGNGRKFDAEEVRQWLLDADLAEEVGGNPVDENGKTAGPGTHPEVGGSLRELAAILSVQTDTIKRYAQEPWFPGTRGAPGCPGHYPVKKIVAALREHHPLSPIG